MGPRLYYYELFDQLQLESPAVIGHSFGGMVAAELASSEPSRVGKLVLLSPVGLWRDDAPVKNWMSMAPDDLVKELFYEPEGPVAKQVLAESDDAEERLTNLIQNTWNLGCTGKFTWPIPDKGLKKRMHRIQAPTLVIWGQQDGLVPAIYAHEFTSRIAGSRSVIVDRAAHVPQLEQLATVSQAVEDFLKG